MRPQVQGGHNIELSMQAKRRVIAFLLLFLFVPASVLAAMPLSFCFGSDGHRAIEYVVHGEHLRAELGLAFLLTDGTEQLAYVMDADEHPDCMDVALLGEAQSAERLVKVEKPNKPGNDVPACRAPRRLEAEAAARSALNSIALRPHSSPTSPQLVALRTVVLRI
jgi:hypothetical protein